MRGLILLVFAWPLMVQAVEAELSGFIGAEMRGFLYHEQFDGQFKGLQFSSIIQPELEAEYNNGRDQYRLILFVRLDSQDDRRTHSDLREAYWRHIADEWELLVGFSRVFWGVTESRHLVDIINQTDFVEGIDNEDKLGQPMFNLATQRVWGSFNVYVMPWFRERTFPGKRGRLRFPLVVDGDVEFESGAGQHHVDVAVRYDHYVAEWDLGLYCFRGTGREPRLVPNSQGTRLITHYDQINQVGTDIQYTTEAWLWKFEGLVREGQGDTFAATVAGFEYTLYQIGGTFADLGLLAEYLYDGRDSDPAVAPPTPFDDDYFLGARLALNDTQDTNVLLGVIVDRDDHSRFFSIEAERRLGVSWTIEIEGRWFSNIGTESDLAALTKDSFVGIRLSHHF
ncbi:MAG: hypothetical protein B6D72_15495 [gamma proteobacterium symbiont of Ctena orbiculata]|nr:MAG: hypothetical protein B6D72_15495 [gamma proteobacterium symbiont of Ctena orbiculata]